MILRLFKKFKIKNSKIIIVYSSPSKTFLYLLLSFILGVLASSIFRLPYEEGGRFLIFLSGFFAVLGLFFLILFWRKSRFVWGFFVLFFSFGIFWYQSGIERTLPDTKDMAQIIKQKSTQGVIIDEPEFKNDRAEYVLLSEDCNCKIVINTSRYPDYSYGDSISIAGKIKEPENFSEDFDYKSYLAKDDIFLAVYNPKISIIKESEGLEFYKSLYGFKNKIEDIFKENIPEPHASLLAGITLGSRSGLPKDTTEDFKNAGVSHVIALSGYNISVIAWAVMSMMMFFMVARNLSFFASVILIVLFVLMTGSSASVARAGTMGLLALTARQQGRAYKTPNALIFAGALMIFLNPKILRFDVGFQLSFLATLGLILVYPRLSEKFKNIPRFFGIKDIFITSVSAQIFVLPLIYYQFGTVSWIGIIANILILPVVPFAMFFGFLGGFIGLVYAPLSKIILWPAWIFLEWMLEVVKML